MGRRARAAAHAVLHTILLLLPLLAGPANALCAEPPAAFGPASAAASVSLRSGSSRAEEDGEDDDSKAQGTSSCGDSLWELAKGAPDLRMLVAVQELTTLNFFTPFGKKSRRHFTLLAPTDAAFHAVFNGTTPEELQSLKDGFPALLLYHQYLSHGYSAEELAQRFEAITALGPSVNEPQLKVDIDKNGGAYVVSGMAPNNYARVVREQEACGNHLLVLDTMLRPMPELSQLPKLQSMDPIKGSQWREVLSTMRDSALGLGSSSASSSDGNSSSGGSSSNTSSGGGGGGGGGGGDDGASRPRNQEPEMVISEAASAPAPPSPPPLPPGARPDCSVLAASGQLINMTGSMAVECRTVEGDGAVISSGSTQTAVSDAGQIDPAAVAPPPPSPGSAAPARARARLAAAGLALAAAWLLLLSG